MTDVVNQICGFMTIMSGTFLLHTTRDMDVGVTDVAKLAKSKSGSATGVNGLQMQALPVTRPLHRTSSSGVRDS
jgi:hypothetical protein